MRKILVSIAILLSTVALMAQPPAGYYDSANGLSGQALKTALFNIIKSGVTTITYDGLYNAYKTTDNLPTNKVWDMYSMKMNGTANYYFTHSSDNCGNYSAEGDCYNREHTTPASWFNDASPMYSDLFNVYPTDGYVNNRRSNYPYGEVGNATYTSSNGSKLGSCSFSGYSGTVFEPNDTFKGDFARTYLYMATRYQDKVASWPGNSTECAAFYAGNNTTVFKTWAINLLLKWCTQDPVSQKEINRNNAVYALQHNRNPYIDHPEWIAMIWGSNASVEDVDLSQSVMVYPNPAQDICAIDLTENLNTQKVSVEWLDITGKSFTPAYEIVNNSFRFNTSNLAKSIYFVKISDSQSGGSTVVKVVKQ